MAKVEQAKHLNLNPQIKVFAVLYVLYAGFAWLTFQLTHHRLHMALAWNLFLAFLPLLFSTFVGRPKQKKWTTILWLILWLLFFPNAIYVITDVIHLGELSFYGGRFYEVSRVVYVRDIAIWCELVTTIAGVFLALIMGLLSLLNIHKFLLKHMSKMRVWLMIGGFSLISSCAIFIGRFLRFNSWDVVAKPWRTMTQFFQNLDAFALAYIGLITFFTLFIYVIFYQLIKGIVKCCVKSHQNI
ncbi:DUF1361 domain-containing protein [Candidatus Saccharibacteria bacterium]|nr:DUF1361 domain-containing protein [Candidatus Saccharibacteria bacterium]